MRKFTVIRRGTPIAVALAGLSTLSCSSAPESRIDPPSHGGASSLSHAGASSSSANPASGIAASGGAPSLAVSAGGATSAGAGGSAVCSAQVREGQRVPIDMYFLVDSSGSMDDEVFGGTKWELVSTALTDFLRDPRNADTGVGIGYFPAFPAACSKGQSGCHCSRFSNVCYATEQGSCEVSDYSTPSVPLALPARTASVISDINAHEIGGGTPTRPALEGALDYLSHWADQHPARKPVLVLATDGEPVNCDRNMPEDVADVAASALASPSAIRTFVIGVGDSLDSLDLVAQAGGTDYAFLVDTGGDVAQEFGDALEQIRGSVASCDFSIPEAGAAIDPSKVNVSYLPKGASTPSRVAQTFMGEPKNCDSNGGWYYDDPKSPTLIKLCQVTCESLSSGSIQVEFGCDTVEQPPPR